MASKAGSRTVEFLENPILQLDAAHLLIMFHGAIVALLMAPAFLTAKWLG